MERACFALALVALCACSSEQTAGPGERDGASPAVPVASEPGSAAAATADPPAAPAPSPDAPAAAAPAPPTAARWDGYAGLRLGMPVDAARGAWAGELRGDAIADDACGYLMPEGARNGAEFGLMFEGGRFVRYDVGTAREAAPGGGRVGMTRAEIEALYPGRVEVRGHEYVPQAHYLRVRDPGAPARALVFETDEQGRIARWRVGQAPQVDYVEGCS